MRLNLACSKETLEEGLLRIKKPLIKTAVLVLGQLF